MSDDDLLYEMYVRHGRYPWNGKLSTKQKEYLLKTIAKENERI